jgi:VWFA-related protein
MRLTPYLRALSAFVAVVLLATSAPAFRLFQQTTPPPPKPPATQEPEAVVRISTQLVQIDVAVTDKKEAHVHDLRLEDFALLVDGKRQTITHFSLVRLPDAVRAAPGKAPPAALPGTPIQPEQVQRTIAFVVDDLGLSFSSMHYARQAIKKFVDEQMQDGDLVGIIRTGKGLGALQQFTSDRRILYAAIENLTWNPFSRNMLPRFGAAANENPDDPLPRANANLEEFTDTVFSLGTLSALNFVVRGLRELPGRKIAILLSDGLSLFGRDRDNQQVLERVRRLTDLANRSSVVIYALDAKGLQTLLPTAADDLRGLDGPRLAAQLRAASQRNFESQEGLVYLARETGGLAVLNNNDLNFGVQKVLRDSQSYYLLGFDPEDQQFDKRYHSIKVSVKRPGLQVRTRGGFFGVPETARPAPPSTREGQILSALFSPFGARDLKLQMTSLFFNLPSSDPNAPRLPAASPPRQVTVRSSGVPGRPDFSMPATISFARSLFHIDCSQLTFKDGAGGVKVVTLELATFAFNEDGEVVDQHGRSITLSFSEEQYRLVLARGLLYTADVPLSKPGAYQFRAVLRDAETGRLGSASQFIQVPDLGKNRLALSGLVLSAPADGSAAPGDAPANQQPAASDAQPTPAVRRFARSSEIEYAAIAFNAKLDEQTRQPRLTMQVEIYRDGKLLYQAPPRPAETDGSTDFKRLVCGGRLQLQDFPAGDYLLHLVVTDPLAKPKDARAEQWMDFSVR